ELWLAHLDREHAREDRRMAGAVRELHAIRLGLAVDREQAHVEPRRDVARVSPPAVLVEVRARDAAFVRRSAQRTRERAQRFLVVEREQTLEVRARELALYRRQGARVPHLDPECARDQTMALHQLERAARREPGH